MSGPVNLINAKKFLFWTVEIKPETALSSAAQILIHDPGQLSLIPFNLSLNMGTGSKKVEELDLSSKHLNPQLTLTS